MTEGNITEVTRVIRDGQLVSVITAGPIYEVLQECITPMKSKRESRLDSYRARHHTRTAEELNYLLSQPTSGSQDYDKVSAVGCDLGYFWLTGLTHGYQMEAIQKIYSFDCVVSLGRSLSLDEYFISERGVERFAYSVSDTSTPDAADALKQTFNPIFEALDTRIPKGERILIHCAAGVSRSASVVIAYLMYRDRINGTQASLGDYLEYLRSCRSCIHPNLEFLRLLSRLSRGEDWN